LENGLILHSDNVDVDSAEFKAMLTERKEFYEYFTLANLTVDSAQFEENVSILLFLLALGHPI